MLNSEEVTCIAWLAQLAERETLNLKVNLKVAGSTPALSLTKLVFLRPGLDAF